MRRRKTEILISGAGPIGLFAALVLNRKEVDVRLIDEEWRPTQRSYALALHPYSLELLDNLGLAEELISQGEQIDKVAFFDDQGERRFQLDLSTLDSKFPFVLVLPQSILESHLTRTLQREGTRVQWNHKLAVFQDEQSSVSCTVERLTKESAGYSVAGSAWVIDQILEYESKFLVGADGSQSAVRKGLGTPFRSVGEAQIFGVFEFESSQEKVEELKVVLGAQGISVFWPLSSTRGRWSFELGAKEFLEEREKKRTHSQRDSWYPYLPEERLHELIEERAPWFKRKVGALRWSAAVRFENRLVENFGRRRVWLAGDAAHLAAPMAVWSMNYGLREAQELSDALRNSEGPDDFQPLHDYNRRWKEIWSRLLTSEYVTEEKGLDSWTRENLSSIIACTPCAHSQTLQMLGVRDKDGSLVG